MISQKNTSSSPMLLGSVHNEQLGTKTRFNTAKKDMHKGEANWCIKSSGETLCIVLMAV